MERGKRFWGALAVVCLVVGGCARLEKAAGLTSPAADPRPPTAIALSVLADSIYLLDPESGRQQTVAAGLADFQSGYAAWSPDRTLLAYGDAGIWLVNPGTLKAAKLVSGLSESMPAWSPKGKQLVYGDGTTAWIATIAAPKPVQLKMGPTLASFGFDWAPSAVIAFEGLQLTCPSPKGPCSSTDRSDIWTIHPNGTGLTQVTATGDASSPKWSPDASRILYVRTFAKPSLGSQLWVARANGTAPRALTGFRNVVAADWSPDGTRVVVIRASQVDQTLEVWVGNSDGTGMHVIADHVPGTSATVDW